jgi:hypothetical protein
LGKTRFENLMVLTTEIQCRIFASKFSVCLKKYTIRRQSPNEAVFLNA